MPKHPQTREKNLRRRYGIGLVEYEALLESQGGLCAICQQPLEKVHVDHCHTSGEVRGLLCPQCNSGIALLREDPRIINAAARYVVRHSGLRSTQEETNGRK